MNEEKNQFYYEDEAIFIFLWVTLDKKSYVIPIVTKATKKQNAILDENTQHAIGKTNYC